MSYSNHRTDSAYSAEEMEEDRNDQGSSPRNPLVGVIVAALVLGAAGFLGRALVDSRRNRAQDSFRDAQSQIQQQITDKMPKRR